MISEEVKKAIETLKKADYEYIKEVLKKKKVNWITILNTMDG